MAPFAFTDTELLARIGGLTLVNEQLERLVAALEARVAELERRLEVASAVPQTDNAGDAPPSGEPEGLPNDV